MHTHMQLTKNFSLSEFEHSETASRLGIGNKMPADLVLNARHLCENVLQPLRDHFGVPVHINSGYRCPRLNEAVGGVPMSLHMTGRAADLPFHCEWYYYIRDHLPHKELINEGTWIHVAL